MQELRFDNRVAVITGSGRGLGRAYAALLGSKGAKVVVNDPGYSLKGEGVDAGLAEEVVGEIKAAGGEAVTCTESVATPDGGKAIIQAALDHFGKIDILIHNAGNVRYGSLQDMPQEDFDSVVNTHLKGAFHLIRTAFPIMAKAKYGRVVLTSSIGGLYGNYKIANYAVSKAGMMGLNNVVALEGEEYGIKCNVIVPGAVTRMAQGLDTSKFPPMSPDLVAPVVGWLAHEACSITGEMLVSMAGRVARAFIAETEGVYHPSWTMEQVGAEMGAIRDESTQWVLPVVPSAHEDHILKSFELGRRGDAKPA